MPVPRTKPETRRPREIMIDFGQLLGQANRVVENRQRVTEQDDLWLFRNAREDRGLEVHRRAHAGRSVVMLVEHQAVEADFLAELVFVEVLVIEIGAELRD